MKSLSQSTPSLSRNPWLSRNAERAIAAAAIVLLLAGVLLGANPGTAPIGLWMRWAGLALFAPVALGRRSLLLWTFFAMLAGMMLGADAPHFAGQMKFIGDIFLRLIRMIVAPLIFGGIVTGIAGHSELKGVGRVAVKAIVFFEVVTTIGLALGLVAINLSQAGVGAALPAPAHAGAPHSPYQGRPPGLLNIFPGNIA